jgi:hypothetical protein
MLVPSRIGDEDSIRREEKSRLPADLFVREQRVRRSGCHRSNVKDTRYTPPYLPYYNGLM